MNDHAVFIREGGVRTWCSLELSTRTVSTIADDPTAPEVDRFGGLFAWNLGGRIELRIAFATTNGTEVRSMSTPLPYPPTSQARCCWLAYWTWQRDSYRPQTFPPSPRSREATPAR